MAKYITLTGLRRNGDRVPPDTEIEMSPREAEPLVNRLPRPALRPVTPEKSGAKQPAAGKKEDKKNATDDSGGK